MKLIANSFAKVVSAWVQLIALKCSIENVHECTLPLSDFLKNFYTSCSLKKSAKKAELSLHSISSFLRTCHSKCLSLFLSYRSSVACASSCIFFSRWLYTHILHLYATHYDINLKHIHEFVYAKTKIHFGKLTFVYFTGKFNEIIRQMYRSIAYFNLTAVGLPPYATCGWNVCDMVFGRNKYFTGGSRILHAYMYAGTCIY